MASKEKLPSYIKEHNILAKLISYNHEVKSVTDSAAATGISLENIVKTVLFQDEQQQLYAIILGGKDKVNTKVIKKHFTVKKLSLVPFAHVEDICGYPAGGVPPFGYQAIFVLDSSLNDEQEVYAGGGTTSSLLKTTIKEIKRITQPLLLPVAAS